MVPAGRVLAIQLSRQHKQLKVRTVRSELTKAGKEIIVPAGTPDRGDR
jgi:hypothetical protein